MGMGNSFETITVLQYRLKAAQEELAAFQSGEKYIRMEKQHLTQVRALERRIAKLEAAVAKEHSHAITLRNQWFEIFEHRHLRQGLRHRQGRPADLSGRRVSHHTFTDKRETTGGTPK